MIVNCVISQKFRSVVGGLTAAVFLIAASPAFANSSASADISAPLRAAQAAKPSVAGTEDEQFRKLFNSWQSFEGDSVPALAAVAEAAGQTGLTATPRAYSPRPEVSIPSRMPVEGITLTSAYGMRTHPVLGGRRAHKGVDLAGPVGTPVHATADGIVSRASWFSSYGLYVSLEHSNDIQTRYAHMSRLNVAEGQSVKKGEIIGFIGTTGRSTGPHLHYEVRVHGESVNPVPYMQADHIAASTGNAVGVGGSK